MCGGSGQTTQQVTIPPEVLARYNAVNAKAEEVAATPFQQYSTDPSAFVAQLNPTQQAGIQNVSNAQNIAQPYFQGATSQLMAGQNTATPYYGQATQELMGGLQAGMTGTQGAYQPMAAGAQQAQNLQGGAYGQYQNALQTAQPYNQAATAGIMGGLAGSQGYNAMAGQGYNQAQAGAQPYLGAATGLGLAGTQAVNANPLGGEQINQYMSPYLNSVVGSTMANLRQQQGQEQSSLLGNQISQGAFGGDRGRVAQANLARQQDLATGQTVSGLMNQGYGQALGAAQQQQQLGLGAAQANRAALQQGAGQLAALGQQGYAQGMGTAQAQQGLGQQIYGQGLGAGQALAGIGQQQYGQQSGTGQNLAALGQQQFGQGAAQTAQQAALAQQQYGMGLGASQQLAGLGQAQYGMGAATSQALAGLGTQAQQNALGAAQAQIGAGTLGQQTEQAGKQALYNQFLQQQGYPFQTTQFLANIAEGTGALSGSTTTTNQPMPFFSDERLKEAVEPIGKTFDGQKIVKFRYKNEPGTRIGLIAQDVEKHHPDAVGLAAGYKTVDYDAATKEAAKKGHYGRGGLAPESEGGAVFESNAREGFARGGEDASLMTSKQLAELLKYQLAMYGGGMPGISGGETPYGQGIVDPGVAPGYDLAIAGDVPELPEGAGKDAANSGKEIADLYQSGKKIKADWDKSHPEYRGGLIRPHAATGGPYGTSMSSVRPRKLMVAGDAPPIPESTFKQIMDTAGSIAGIASAGADAYNSMSGGSGGPDMGSGGSGTWSESTGLENFKRGGLIPGYAPGGLAPKPSNEDSKVSDSPYGNTNPAGGLPYAGSKGYIPAQSTEQNAPTSLANPGKVGKPEPIGNEIIGLGKDAAAIAAAVMMMKRGGRIGKEDGGPLDVDYQGEPKRVPVKTEELPPTGAYSTLSPAEKVAFNARVEDQLNAAGNAPQDRTPVPNQQHQNPAQAPAKYANVPFENVQSNIIKGENRGVADPYNSVYGNGQYGTIEGGPASHTIGDVQDFQRNVLIPATRGKIAGVAPNLGTGATGAYGFTHETLGSIAPQVFGKDWRNVPFKQENQDKMARALYEQNRGNDANLARQWATFSGLAPSGAALAAQQSGASVPPKGMTLADAPPAVITTGGLGGTQYAQANTGNMTDAAPAGLQPSSRVPMPKPDIEAGPYSKTERWLLPLLTGLGTMAGSSSRYGLGAALQGVGGAAEQYGKMQAEQYSKGQEQQAKGIEAQTAQTGTTEAQNRIRQTDLEIIRLILSNLTKQYDSLTGQSIWINSITGQKLTDDQRDDLVQKLNTLGNSRLGGIGQPSVPRLNIAGGDTNAPPPGSATPSLPPARQGATAPPVKTSFSGPATPGHPSVIGVPVTSIQVDESRLPEAYRPSVLNRIIQKANSDILNINNDQTLDPDTKKQQLEGLNNIVQNANRRRVDLQSGNVFDESGQPIMEARNLHEQTAVNMAVNQKTPDVVQGVQTALLTLNKAADVLKNYATGAYSAPFAQASQWLGSGENASNRQVLSKEAVNSIIAQLNASARPLGAGIGVMNEVSDATFGPDLQPSANKTVLAQIYGQANWNQALAKAKQSAFAANQSYDQGKFVEDWSAANPIKQFEEAAYKNLPVLGASPKIADNSGWRKEYNDHGPGGLYIIPANDNPSGKDLLVRFKGIAKDGLPIVVPERQ